MRQRFLRRPHLAAFAVALVFALSLSACGSASKAPAQPGGDTAADTAGQDAAPAPGSAAPDPAPAPAAPAHSAVGTAANAASPGAENGQAAGSGQASEGPNPSAGDADGSNDGTQTAADAPAGEPFDASLLGEPLGLYELLNRFDAVTYSVRSTSGQIEPSRIAVQWDSDGEYEGETVSRVHHLHFSLEKTGDSTDPADADTHLELWFDASGRLVAATNHTEGGFYTDELSLALGASLIEFTLFPFSVFGGVLAEALAADKPDIRLVSVRQDAVLGNPAELMTLHGASEVSSEWREFHATFARFPGLSMALELALDTPGGLTDVWTVTPEVLDLR